MSDVTVKRIEELASYEGAHAVEGMRFRYAAKQLGVSAWGMNVIEIDAGCEKYPDHDHAKDGQEEVYVVLRGAATLRAEGREWKVETGAIVRVGPQQKRKFVPGPEGVTLLALGGVPGKAYPAK